MPNTPEIYCHRCQQHIQPIKRLVVFCCPTCGANFTPAQIEQARNYQKPDQPNDSDTALI